METSLTSVEFATIQDAQREAHDHGVALPLEQTDAWMEYQNTIPGRRYWGSAVIRDGDEVVALISLVEFTTHGYRFLRSWHGPVWVSGTPSRALEESVLAALSSAIRHRDGSQLFLRCAVWFESPLTHSTLSSVPYDHTVVIDVTGGDDAILARMKRRGRRDVRKSLRECPATCADETTRAIGSFADYYDIMVETGARDGFAPAPIEDYETMLRTLGEDHCRVFAARHDGKVIAWSIVTVNGTRAVRYYAAMRTDAMRMHATDRLLYWECCELGRRGLRDYDLMGIGSDFSPTLNGLNEFKTKFTEDVAEIAPDRDVPLRRGLYRGLTAVKAARSRLRHRTHPASD